jgi:acetolactate synthase-1/2/3 large subunit
MGYDLPAAIGAAVASGNDVICIAGDGSLQMNLQELQTVKHHALPVKLFVLNNRGYHSIVQTQNNCFDGNLIGCDETSGISFPDNEKLAALYGMKFIRIESIDTLDNDIDVVLETDGPVFCEVVLSNDYQFKPKLAAERLMDGSMRSPSLEDMYPFLDRIELSLNMLVKGNV